MHPIAHECEDDVGASVHSRSCHRSSTSSRSARTRRTATSCVPTDPPPRRSSSTRAAPRRRSASGSRRSARAARRSSSRTVTSITSSASPTSRRAPRRPVHAPAAELTLFEEPGRFAPAGITARGWTPEVLLEGDETLELAGIRFDVVSVPGHSPGHVAYAIDGALLSGDVLFAGSVGSHRPPRRGLGDAARVAAHAGRHVSRRHRRPSGPRPVDDARPGARPQPVPRRAAARARRSPSSDRSTEARAAARHP